MKLSKKIAMIAAGSLLSVGGLYAVSTSANAAAPTAPAVTSPASGIQAPTGISDSDDLQEGDQNGLDDTTESASDGANVGADLNSSESGHQDAPGADDASEGVDTAEVASE